MVDDYATGRAIRRAPKPLDRIRLEELAVAYVARFATSAGKLEAYLRRKLRERGFEGDEPPDLDQLVARFVAKGYVDDEVFGRSKANGLLARGYGGRRIEQALRAAEIDEDLRQRLAPDEEAKRESAIALARRRRFGPFDRTDGRSAEELAKLREKRLAAMIRAGHEFDHARRVLDAVTIKELEQWVAESRED